MVDILIEAPVLPKAKERARRGKNGVMYTPGPTRKWEATLALLASEKLPDRQLQGPIRVDILAAKQRTKELLKQYKRDNVKLGIKAGQYKHPTGLIWCPTKPDKDNIEKAVLDALKPFWTDDALVVCGETMKAYHEIDKRPRVVVRIQTVEEDPNERARELGLVEEVSCQQW